MMLLLCMIGLHRWRDNHWQPYKLLRHQTCVRCGAGRTIERESFGL